MFVITGYYGDDTKDEEGIIRLTIDEIQENVSTGYIIFIRIEGRGSTNW